MLEINFWKFGVYRNRHDSLSPPPLIEPDRVLSQACRLAIADPQKDLNTFVLEGDEEEEEDEDDEDEDEEAEEEEDDEGPSSRKVGESVSKKRTFRGDEEVWITIGLTKVRNASA